MLLEIVGNTGQEFFLTNPGNQLLEYRGTLCVGDAVKIHLNIFQIINLGNNRVGRWKLILTVGPRLL